MFERRSLRKWFIILIFLLFIHLLLSIRLSGKQHSSAIRIHATPQNDDDHISQQQQVGQVNIKDDGSAGISTRQERTEDDDSDFITSVDLLSEFLFWNSSSQNIRSSSKITNSLYESDNHDEIENSDNSGIVMDQRLLLQLLESAVQQALKFEKLIESNQSINFTDFNLLKNCSQVYSQLHYLSSLNNSHKATENTEKRYATSNTRDLHILTSFFDKESPIQKSQLESTLSVIEKKLYPWLQTSVSELISTYSGRGIVMTTGRWHFHLAVLAISSIRKVLNSDIPIEVFYAGGSDLPPENVKILSQFDNVRVRDILPHLTFAPQGWAVKPFSLLLSSFQEAIFIDADTLFLQDPKTLFSSTPYQKFGALFFHDRSMNWGENQPVHEFVKEILPNPSSIFKETRFYKEKTVHELDSGVVTINKRSPALYALLTTCKLNHGELKNLLYDHFHGDKETFWLAHELVRIPYEFMPFYGGAIGYYFINKGERHVCGGLLHVDEEKKPLWWNGGIQTNKYHSADNFLNFTDYAIDILDGYLSSRDIKEMENGPYSGASWFSKFNVPRKSKAEEKKVEWIWETEKTPFCMKIQDEVSEIHSLNHRESKYTEHYINLAKVIAKKGYHGNVWDDVMDFVNNYSTSY